MASVRKRPNGKWRVRYYDPDGRERAKDFARKTDADRFAATVEADKLRGQFVDPALGRVTVAAYAKTWREQQLHRDSTTERVERTFRLHIVPMLGGFKMDQVRPSHLKLWVRDRSMVLSPSTLRVGYSCLASMFAAAVADRVLGSSPCTSEVRLPTVERSDHYIPPPAQVHALADALPPRYRAAVYLAAGAGHRWGEVFGTELGDLDFLRREGRIERQLKVMASRAPYLGAVKTATSRRAFELADVVSEALAEHVRLFPPADVEIEDETNPRRLAVRTARLLFTSEKGRPLRRAEWSRIWRPARKAAGLPDGFGLHGLRHYFATLLIFAGADVKMVQLALGHSNPTITLNTYIGLWPGAVDRVRSLVDASLGETATNTTEIVSGAD